MNPDAAREAHETLVGTDLYANVIDAAGGYDAKLDSSANCSLAAHLLNAVTVGVNTFAYEAVGEDESVYDYTTEIKVLAAALALHDTNKFVREAHGYDADGNTREAFAYYFDPDGADESGDPFGVEAFLDGDYREDLLYLVQRTELTEDSTETRATDTEFRGLERYCRIGDAVASESLRTGVDGAYDQLCTFLDDDDVHRVDLHQLEQPILNEKLVSVTKEVIAGVADTATHGVIIGSTPNSVVYLGNELDRETIRAGVKEYVPKRIESECSFSCKLGWNTFSYDILEEVEIPLDRKINRIGEQAEDLLLSGSGLDEGFENVPPDFVEFLPFLIKAVYEEGWNEYPTQKLTETYKEVYNSIEGSESAKAQKVKVRFLARLCEDFNSFTSDLEKIREATEDDLRSDLEPESDAIGTVVDRFFDGRVAPELGAKGEMCFLCGAEADTKYQKGLSAVYRTQEYSRRVPPHAKYKSICEVCNLEYALLADLCETHGVSTNNAVEVAYFYFDDFLGDVRLRSSRMGNLVQGEGDELDDTEVTVSLLEGQYFLQPLYVLDQNHRMSVVRRVMQAAQESGMKVVVGRPFARFDSASAVFTDEEATRPQELLGLDEAERFGPLPEFAESDRSVTHLRRALQLFKIMSMVGQEANLSNPYLHLDRDEFHTVVDFAVVNHEHATRLSDLREYLETYHEDQLMEMRTVAERGIDLFGRQYDSKYKKTKVFREALDAYLSGMNQQMDDEQLLDHVESQVYAAADREDYAGRVTTEEAEAFVAAIREYLVANDLDDLKKLSDWEDALVNSYYYAYDQALQTYQ